MKITELRKYAAEQGIAEEEALKRVFVPFGEVDCPAPIWGGAAWQLAERGCVADQPQQRSKGQAPGQGFTWLGYPGCCDWLSAQSRSGSLLTSTRFGSI